MGQGAGRGKKQAITNFRLKTDKATKSELELHSHCCVISLVQKQFVLLKKGYNISCPRTLQSHALTSAGPLLTDTCFTHSYCVSSHSQIMLHPQHIGCASYLSFGN